MALNAGYTYREQVGLTWQGAAVLEYLCAQYAHSDAGTWQARLSLGEVCLNDRPASGEERLKAGQIVTWQRPPWQEEEVPLHFELLHQDAELLAVAKPGRLPTVPGGGFLTHTLLHLVRQQFPEASPLHRLGRGTSGLVLFARTSAAAAQLSAAWREHQVGKRYLALGKGQARQEHFDIRAAIGPVPHPRLGEVWAASPAGKPSQSRAQVMERRSGPTRSGSTLFEVDIRTGRPHQIRIHLAWAGHPLVGDPLYGALGLPLSELPGLPGDGGYWLHSHRLRFRHPGTNQVLELVAPPPPELEWSEPR
jgi:23S rRNA pseudouridine1911/1915/1917 synthase